MSQNQQLIEQFYTAFQNKDYKTMQNCYADHATFHDDVFRTLNTSQLRSMWEMLIKRGTDLKLSFSNIYSTDNTGGAEWVATYTFSGRKVVNKVKAKFVFENGKIIEHVDSFSFYRWAQQALGPIGLFWGWTGFLKNKVHKTVMKNLDEFISSSN